MIIKITKLKNFSVFHDFNWKIELPEFKKFNLISDSVPQILFDAILCRNVMIYFDFQTSEKVIHKLYQALVPKGYFAIGNAESLMNMKHSYTPVKKIPSLYIK